MPTPLIEAIYAEQNRQDTAGRRDLELLDRMRALLFRGAPVQVGEQVSSTLPQSQGRVGFVAAVLDLASVQVQWDDDGSVGTQALADLQRDWVQLAAT